MRTHKGFIAILTVLALLALSLPLTLSVTYLSIGGSQSALAIADGEAAFQAANGCAEDALVQSLRDESYEGDTYTYLDALCDVSVAKDGEEWTLVVTAAKNGYERSLTIVFDRTPGSPGSITLRSWMEQ